MNMSIQSIYRQVVDDIDAILIKMVEEHRMLRQIIGSERHTDTMPQTTDELQLAIEQQYYLIREREWYQQEMKKAQAELARLQQQQQQHEEQIQASAPHIQSEIQQTLAEVQARQDERRTAEVDTQRLTPTPKEREALDLLQCLADGKSRATKEITAIPLEMYSNDRFEYTRSPGEDILLAVEKCKQGFFDRFKKTADIIHIVGSCITAEAH